MEVSLSVIKKRYKEAVEQKKDRFILKVKGEEAVLLTDYAKYLIEYLQNEYGKRGLRDTYKTTLINRREEE